MDDRYLWDRRGPADPEVERLERELGRFRHRRQPLRQPSGVGRRRFAAARLLAAAAILVAAAGVLRVARSGVGTGWRAERIAGAPRLGTRPLADGAFLSVGERIETDAVSRAKLSMGRIAEIALSPASRVRLVRSAPAEQRLALDRGKISARISAPPRLFSVETPSALAVDLGCSYTLEVDASGAGLLRVETGWVSFERDARESVVPAGAACATRVREGPGTPFYEDAAPQLLAALERYDFGGGSPDDLTAILAASRKRDGLTLWHLLLRAERSDRERVYERFARLVPPPAPVTREGILAGDDRMLERWRWELDGMPLLPRAGSFRSFLGRLWFRLAGTW